MKKRILSLVLVICLVCTLLPLTASATQIVDSGKLIGSDISWTLDSTGLLTLSGSGEMPPCSMEMDVPWFQYSEDITAAVVEDGITSIGKYCFYKCFFMERISIPNSVTSIGSKAFYWCRSLTELTLPDSVQTIADQAFYNCDYLETITLGSSLSYIGNYAFDSCRALTEITIPAGIETLESYCFQSCESLVAVTFLGDAPRFVGSVFSGAGYLTGLTCYYPENNPTWTSDVMQHYGSRITWEASKASSGTSIPGDVTGDNLVDDFDVAALLWHVLFPDMYNVDDNADFTGDGNIDDADVAYLLWHILFPNTYPL